MKSIKECKKWFETRGYELEVQTMTISMGDVYQTLILNEATKEKVRMFIRGESLLIDGRMVYKKEIDVANETLEWGKKYLKNLKEEE